MTKADIARIKAGLGRAIIKNPENQILRDLEISILTVERLQLSLREVTQLTRFIINNRGCICNVPGHRCGTNLMLADVAKIEEHLS